MLFDYGPDGETAADPKITAHWIPFFSPGLVPRLLAYARQERVIFFQAQLRYLAVEVIRLDAAAGEDLPVVANNASGELLLRAGELLYFEHEKPTDPMDVMANLIVQFLPIYEIDSPTDPSMLLLRFYIFLTVNIPRLQRPIQNIRCFRSFLRNSFGFPLKTYCEFLLCLFMHAMMQREKKTVAAAMESEIKVSTFQNTSVPSDLLNKMFETVSFSLDTLSGLRAPVGYADFDFLRDHPYFRHEEALYCLRL